MTDRDQLMGRTIQKMSRKAKITVTEREAIKTALAAGGITLQALAKQYKVSYASIWRIARELKPATPSTTSTDPVSQQ